MNRIEIISLFTAMEVLSSAKQYEGLDKVIRETLAAAKGEKPLPYKKDEEEK